MSELSRKRLVDEPLKGRLDVLAMRGITEVVRRNPGLKAIWDNGGEDVAEELVRRTVPSEPLTISGLLDKAGVRNRKARKGTGSR